MAKLDHSTLLSYRLHNQQLSGSQLKKPEEVVHWMGAMQAQEYAMAKWAIGLRLKDATESIVEKAFDEGSILRTHLMRPTWHFVSPADIRWLLKLTAPRVHQASAYMYRQLGLDKKFFNRCNKVLEKALEGKFLMRTELQAELLKKKITADGHKLGYIMMNAELEQLICSGPRKGKQFTYALLDERVPSVKPINKEEALTTLADRYFRSRGPVTVQDFAYWSGLTMKDSIAGAASLDKTFVREKVNGKEFIFIPPPSKTKLDLITFLMPDYDEYGMSYKDRSALTPLKKLDGPRGGSIVFNRMIVIDGRIEGSWQRTLKKDEAKITLAPFTPLSKTNQKKVDEAIKGFNDFINPVGKKSKSKK